MTSYEPALTGSTKRVVQRFTVDVSSDGGEISPLWFGHNLEHTRSCVWQGLSAQLDAPPTALLESSLPADGRRHVDRDAEGIVKLSG